MPYAKYFKKMAPEPSSGSEETLKLIQQWDRDYVELHTGYNRRNEKRSIDFHLPARLIDVGPANGSRGPFFISTSMKLGSQKNRARDRRYKYIALSYCWGTKSSITTTVSTIQDRFSKIPLEILPQTIRDAVVVTRK